MTINTAEQATPIIVPTDTAMYELTHFVEDECPDCGRVIPKKPLIMRYDPEQDPGGAFGNKRPYARMFGWLTVWECPCGYEAYGGATTEQIKAWGEQYGGWKRLA